MNNSPNPNPTPSVTEEMIDPTLNGFVMPKVIWLHDLGCGEVTWCEDRDPDGEQIEAVKYVRADIALAMKSAAPQHTGLTDVERLRKALQQIAVFAANRTDEAPGFGLIVRAANNALDTPTIDKGEGK